MASDEETKRYYDAFSENYEARRHGGYHAFIDDLQAEIIRPHVTGKSVLEVGCGTGLILKRIQADAERAIGLDLSPGMLERAKERGLEVVQGSATDLPFASERFGATFSFKVLSHVPELALALSEMARVTQPGGDVFIELYNRHSLRFFARRIRGEHAVAKGVYENQVFYRFYSLTEMKAHLPKNLVIKRIYGVRVFTLLPGVISWPILGRLLRGLETWAAHSFLARYAGFVILHCRRI